MAEVHEGGCSCGAVRYRTKSNPVRVGVATAPSASAAPAAPSGSARISGSRTSRSSAASWGTRAIAGGSFDDPNWLTIERHGWMRSAQRWVALPHDVEVFEKSTLQQPLQVR